MIAAGVMIDRRIIQDILAPDEHREFDDPHTYDAYLLARVAAAIGLTIFVDSEDRFVCVTTGEVCPVPAQHLTAGVLRKWEAE